MSPTAPLCFKSSSSAFEKVFPLLATNAEGSRTPTPTSAKVTFSKRATASLTARSSNRTWAALAEPTTPGAGRNPAQPKGQAIGVLLGRRITHSPQHLHHKGFFTLFTLPEGMHVIDHRQKR